MSDIATQIIDAVHRSWWNVDHDFGMGGERYYTEDGLCAMPASTMHGRAEIAEGYAKRQANGVRLSRHLIANIVVDHGDTGHATALYALCLYAGNGMPPLSVTGPQAICDVVDDYVLCDGAWLIENRRLTAIFVAADNDSVMLAKGESGG